MALRRATVQALFPSLSWIWTTILITEELSTSNSCGTAIFLPLYLSLLSLINSQLLLTIAHPTIKIVVSVQPVVQSRKTHLNYKSFSKIKIYEFSISLARGKSLRTKKEGNFSVFISQFGIKKELISILLTWISSVLPRAATVSLILQIRVLKIRRRELMDDTLSRLFPM